jgi:hypothetical protein
VSFHGHIHASLALMSRIQGPRFMDFKNERLADHHRA